MNESPELFCSANDFPMIKTYTVFTGKAKEIGRNRTGIPYKEIPAEKYKRRTRKKQSMQENHFLGPGIAAGGYLVKIDAGGKSGSVECQCIRFRHINSIS